MDASKLITLTAADEHVCGPDYSVVLSYECRWDELPGTPWK